MSQLGFPIGRIWILGMTRRTRLGNPTARSSDSMNGRGFSEHNANEGGMTLSNRGHTALALLNRDSRRTSNRVFYHDSQWNPDQSFAGGAPTTPCGPAPVGRVCAWIAPARRRTSSSTFPKVPSWRWIVIPRAVRSRFAVKKFITNR